MGIANVKEDGSSVDSMVGELEWVMVNGQGKLNKLNKKYYYQATIVVSQEEAQPLIDEIDEFLKTHQLKKFAKKAPQSLGYRNHQIATGKTDDDTGEKLYEDTGKIAFTFKTETTYKDGNQKKIVIFNAKGKEVDLGQRLIGNGSRGKLKGIIKYYAQEKEHGVSLYLNALQLSKYVEYKGGVQMDELDEEDGFEGFEGDEPALEEVASTDKASAPSKASGKKDRPRL